MIIMISLYTNTERHLSRSLYTSSLSLVLNLFNQTLDEALGGDSVAFEHLLHEELLVGALDEREVALYTVELGAVWHIEHCGDVEALIYFEHLIRLVHREIVEKDGEGLPIIHGRERLKEGDVLRRGDRARVQHVAFEAFVQADC